MATVLQTRRDRALKILDTHCGGSRTRMAEKIGVSKQYIGTILKEPNQPGYKGIGNQLARKVEKTFGYPEGYLDNMVLQSEVIGEESIVIPLLDIRASIGPQAVASTEAIQLLRLSQSWLRENIRGVSPNHLRITTAEGDSMSPTFEHDSTLMVDASVTSIKIDGVYVIDSNGQKFVKRMQRKLQGGYLMISDNPKFPPQEIPQDDVEHLRVLGRVLCEWTPRKV
jgi:phage repressor protein C with HTH and peptisase S24 domain